MNKGITRRDVLKVMGASVLPALFPRQMDVFSNWLQPQKKPNILIIVLDTLSANHLSLYGYPRHTSASMERFAGRATVYHSHFSGGNFTTAGTASMLTGTYPWTHRAINISGLVKRSLVDRNIFQWVGGEYHRMAFTQNMLAEMLLHQFKADINDHLPFTFAGRELLTLSLSRGSDLDPVLSFYAYGDFLAIRQNNDGPLSGSPLLGLLELLGSSEETRKSEEYPFGLPTNSWYTYTNRDTFDAILRKIIEASALDKPFLGYFHLWTPHEPYNARKEFVGRFKKDGYSPVSKPEHILTDMHRPEKNLIRLRQAYDEFITDVDADLGHFLEGLEQSGILDTSYVIITSDHGQLFERGEHGHNTALLFDSVIHIPLIILSPGQTTRRDVYAPTSNIDLLPTLVSLAGKEPNLDMEGEVLPGFGGVEDQGRSIYSMVAKTNSAFAPITIASVTLIKGTKKLIHYAGYGNYDKVSELYDLADDPEELKDLAASDTLTAAQMQDELLTALEESNQAIKAP
ncbi:MAG: sulfatase-like hydrolase/transferase [Chloroflexi bacterium]|nr:sulfatase-like hydrolase/transferase [Chloroflexota bacterium]